ncbi:MAG: G1 family glutamic endopeptidase, partial [Methanobacteriota archaeon]
VGVLVALSMAAYATTVDTSAADGWTPPPAHHGLSIPEPRGPTSTSVDPQALEDRALLRATTGVDGRPGSGVPGKILVDGVPREEWGLNWMKIAPGRYTVSFSDVPAFETPADVVVDASAGTTVEVTGEYREKGFLRVLTDPAVPATISVDGVPRDDWGLWMALVPGSYAVAFGPVDGYAAPPAQTASVERGALTTVTGAYISDESARGPDPSTFGLLRVSTRLDDGRPGVGAQILVDGVPRDEWGLAWVKIDPGTHTVSFSDVPGVGTPASQAVEVIAGATTTAEGVFQRHGSLRVRTDPPAPATIFVDGIPRNDWGMWQSLPPGAYTVAWEAFAGVPAPTPQVVTVHAGELSLATGSYREPLGSLNWAGYVVANEIDRPAPAVTAVRGSWIVPTVEPTGKVVYSAVWIGIGGFFDTSLIQTGTEQDSGQGITFYAAWYELLPDASVRITNRMTACPVLPGTEFCLVRAGDVVSASVVLADAGQGLWTITLTDVTQGWTFAQDFAYVSSRASAEWVVERPFLCTPGSCKISDLAPFTSVALGPEYTGLPETNVALVDGVAAAIGGFPRREVLMFSGPDLLADPSELRADGSSFLVLRTS